MGNNTLKETFPRLYTLSIVRRQWYMVQEVGRTKT